MTAGLVRRLLTDGLAAGDGAQAGPLTLVPLLGGAPAGPYVLCAEALGSGMLTITEQDVASVPELVAANAGDLPALLLDGEHLEGARQHRILNTTVLVPARSRTVIPVSCVERGRWHVQGRPDFAPSDVHAYARLRTLNKEQVARSARAGRGRATDQGAVWKDVAERSTELGAAPSATGWMGDAIRDRRAAIEETLRAFPGPRAGQVGVVACVGGRPVALDVFDRPETLAPLWERLVRGYAMDAIGAEPEPSGRADVDRFLEAAAAADATEHDGVGLGTEVVLTSPEVVGSALVWEGAVVHAAAFARRREAASPRRRSRPIARPSRRAHFHRAT